MGSPFPRHARHVSDQSGPKRRLRVVARSPMPGMERFSSDFSRHHLVEIRPTIPTLQSNIRTGLQRSDRSNRVRLLTLRSRPGRPRGGGFPWTGAVVTPGRQRTRPAATAE
jgi:hypothetical protein